LARVPSEEFENAHELAVHVLGFGDLFAHMHVADAARGMLEQDNYGSVEAGAMADANEKETLDLLRLLMLNMHAFDYGLFYASVGVILLPEEAMALFPEQHAMFLAAMLGCAGLSQLASPFSGYMSDRETSRWGRRIPYLLGGNVVLLVMIGM
jgi:hypothetical protein